MSKSEVTEWVSQCVTRSPIELFWTSKNEQQGVGEEKCREERKGVKKETDVTTASFQSMQITSMAQNWGDSLQCKTKSSSLQGKTIQCSAGKEVNHFAVLSAQANLQIWVENVEGGGWGGWGASWRKGSALMRDLSWNCQKHHRTHPHRHIHCQIVQKYSKLFSSCPSTSSFL